MPSAHRALITLAKKLGYIQDDEGLCHGVTLRCLEAYHLGEQDKFIHRINKIRDIENLDVLIHKAQEKVKQHKTLTPHELELLEIPPFYDSLFLYHNPGLYHDVFNKTLDQINTDETSYLAGSEAIQSQGGLSTLYSEPNSFTQQELRDYLDSLQKIISDDTLNAQCNVGMLLSNGSHAIGLFYQPKRRTWTFMNINQWPPLEVTLSLSPENNQAPTNPMNKLVYGIQLGFGSETHTAFNIAFISTHSERSRLQAFNTKLNQLKNRYPVARVISQGKKNQAELLFIAAQGGHAEVVKRLLDAGVNPNQAMIDGATPLFIAAQGGQVEVVKLLLADPRILPNQAWIDGATPFFIAAQGGHVEVVKLLLADPRILPKQAMADGTTSLHTAALKGQVEIAKILLESPRTDPNQTRTDNKITPLYIAAQCGQVEIVKLLLAAGADPKQAMSNGATPIHTAILFGHFEVAQMLLPAAQKSFDELVQVMLSDEASRTYYLRQMILKPELMQTALIKNKIFLKALIGYKNELWTQLQNPKILGLSAGEHKILLENILCSKQASSDVKSQHPMYSVFKEEPQGKKRSFSLFENPNAPTLSILDSMEIYLNTTYPEEQAGPIAY
jgi:ankyrin repeat protein